MSPILLWDKDPKLKGVLANLLSSWWERLMMRCGPPTFQLACKAGGKTSKTNSSHSLLCILELSTFSSLNSFCRLFTLKNQTYLIHAKSISALTVAIANMKHNKVDLPFHSLHKSDKRVIELRTHCSLVWLRHIQPERVLWTRRKP